MAYHPVMSRKINKSCAKCCYLGQLVSHLGSENISRLGAGDCHVLLYRVVFGWCLFWRREGENQIPTSCINRRKWNEASGWSRLLTQPLLLEIICCHLWLFVKKAVFTQFWEQAALPSKKNVYAKGVVSSRCKIHHCPTWFGSACGP